MAAELGLADHPQQRLAQLRRTIVSGSVSSPTRRGILAAAVVAGSVASFPQILLAATEDSAIRPLHIGVPVEAIVDLRRRVVSTRWPPRESVSDQSQGVQLAKIQPLIRYWGTEYDWRKAESKLNAIPQFVTEIDVLDIQFARVRSRHPNALPLIITHGWPGSVLELLKVVAPLTDPTAFGGRAEDAFHLVLPSMPGYGFSGKPQGVGWGPDHIARAWAELMGRLGYTRYVSQGGDWGSVISDVMARQAPAGLLGIHVNMPATVPPDVARALNNGDAAPSGLSGKEKAAFQQLDTFYKKNCGYAHRLALRGHGLILVAHDRARLEAVAERLRADTDQAIAVVRADLNDKADLGRIETLLRTGYHITVLVNSAGASAACSLLVSDVDEMDKMIALNVTALTRLIYAAVPGFVARGGGTIINIASVLGIAPELLNGVYGGTKSFVLALSQSLHKELAEKNVRIQAVLPGAAATGLWEKIGLPVDHFPTGTVMQAEDMVDAALAGLDQGEVVTIPSLPEVADWQAYEGARQSLIPNLSLMLPAARYQAAAVVKSVHLS
jgi:short-subunit dehydrogenase